MRSWHDDAPTTPTDVLKLKYWLDKSEYDKEEANFLLDGFTHGFTIGYQGEVCRQDTSKNIPLNIGSSTELWNKVMTVVQGHRYAGLYETVPYQNFIQSLIGLVPKAGGKTRQIFHLSYNFKQLGNPSVNACTLKDICKVKYYDLDTAIALCLNICNSSPTGHDQLWLAKSDLRMAFRVLPIKKDHWKYLVMKVKDPETNKFYFFIDKCLPFGASISCSHISKIFKCTLPHSRICHNG